ncbi:hypothetical protein AB0C11_37875 [Streptomyces sp. NPDC039016]|uniref:hypothetical protein n=1 Tax=Streptomyces sp. NPDC039016 TaxID=3154330 RepID=UPI0033D5FC4E
MPSFLRVLAPAVTVLVTLLTFTACDLGREGPDVTKQRLGGPGDLLVGAVLNFDGGEIDGRKFESPPPTEETTYLRNWVEFRHDGTVDLKNDRGDHITLSVTRPAQGFFGTRHSRDIVQTRRKPLTRLSSVTTCTFAEKRWVGEEALAARS